MPLTIRSDLVFYVDRQFGSVGFGSRGPRGRAFRDAGAEAGPGSLIAAEGPSGSGRSSLLLAQTLDRPHPELSP